MGSLPPEIIAQTGRIKQRSMTFAPIILPMDKSCFFLIIDVTVVTSSGSDVPIATRVIATILSGTPIYPASLLPKVTRCCAPPTINAVPRIKKIMLFAMSFVFCFLAAKASVFVLSSVAFPDSAGLPCAPREAVFGPLSTILFFVPSFFPSMMFYVINTTNTTRRIIDKYAFK